MKVLLIGRLEGYVSTAAKIALDKGAKVVAFEETKEALQALRDGLSADIILLDLKCNVAEFSKSLKEERFSIPIIACGVASTAEEAAASIRAGAKEYIPFPPNPELIAAVLMAVSEEERVVLTQDPSMLKWVKLADKIAPSEATVLITGESGTGKEVMAHYIHHKSKRKDKPFVSVNCAAIPENLLESELFGHEKGAFTGAIARRVGKFEEASGGTLLLDEISEMHPRLQAKLLRAIQEKQIDRVGGGQPVNVDIRLIATSNRDLLQAIEQGEFREDLYFRINVVNIHIPPLRDRSSDIELLAKHFIQKFAKLNHVHPKSFTEKALQHIKSHHWRGNVRELQNMMHRALLLSSGDLIDHEDLGFIKLDSDEAVTENAHKNQILIGKTVAEVERELILGTLDHCFGNRTHASHILGISIRTLRNKLKEYEESFKSKAKDNQVA